MTRRSPVLTYGLTHVALAVRDPKRSLVFYEQLVGARAVYTDENVIQVQTPGSRDIIVFEKNEADAGRPGGIAHFGFRLMSPEDIDHACLVIEEAGGVIRDRGEFVPGEPYVFFTDPDGYEVEIWYEIPTRFDPE